MIIRPERIIIVGRSHAIVKSQLTELGIAPLPFTRRGVLILPNDMEGLAGARGQEIPWTVAPDCDISEKTALFLRACTRHNRFDFHELLVRSLAWRIWHEQ